MTRGRAFWAGRIAWAGRVAWAMILASGCLLARPAHAAFELRSANPEAMGAASLDLPFDPLDFDAPGGSSVSASRASLYDVEGLGADALSAAYALGSNALEASWTRVGLAELSESSIRLAWRELGGRVVLLGASLERLAFSVPETPDLAGWAGSGGVTARVLRGSIAIDLHLEADRVARSAALEVLGVEPAAAFGLRLRAGPLRVAAADRWERAGRRSFRLAAEIPIGSIAAVRAGRGKEPGRLGLALEVRWGRLAMAAGRLDDATGGTVSGAGVRLLPKGERLCYHATPRTR